MSEIKLVAKRKYVDERLLFYLSDLFRSAETGLYQVAIEDVGMFAIDPATIQLADDPRKNILDEAKYKIEHLEAGPPVELYRKGYYSAVIEALQILDEMEAKL